MDCRFLPVPGPSQKSGNVDQSNVKRILCLFCYKRFDKNEGENLERFTNLAELWLGRKLCLDGNGECRIIGGCCPNCSILVEQFCSAFDKWKEGETKVESNLDGLLNKMKLANRGPQSLKEMRKRFEEGEGRWIKEFREDLIKAGAQRGNQQQEQTLNLNAVRCKVEVNSTMNDWVPEYFLGWMVTYSAVLCLALESTRNCQNLETAPSLEFAQNSHYDFGEHRDNTAAFNPVSNLEDDPFLDELIGVQIWPESHSDMFLSETGEIPQFQLQNTSHELSRLTREINGDKRVNMTCGRNVPKTTSNLPCKHCSKVFASQRSLKQHGRYCPTQTPKRKIVNDNSQHNAHSTNPAKTTSKLNKQSKCFGKIGIDQLKSGNSKNIKKLPKTKSKQLSAKSIISRSQPTNCDKISKSSKHTAYNEPDLSDNVPVAHCSKTWPKTSLQIKQSKHFVQKTNQGNPKSFKDNSLMKTKPRSTKPNQPKMRSIKLMISKPTNTEIAHVSQVPSVSAMYVESQDQNPLMTRAIFDRLLKFDFSFHDFQQMRLVCKKWYIYSLPKWRNNITVRIGPEESCFNELERPRQKYKVWCMDSYLKSFTDLNHFQGLFEYPYKKYVFKCIILDPEPETPFWDFIGPEIRHLLFEDCIFHGEELATQFEWIFTTYLTSLESLSFSECEVYPSRAIENLFDDRVIGPAQFRDSPKQNLKLKSITMCGILPIDFSVLLINSPNIPAIEINSQIQDKNKFYQKLITISNCRRILEHRPSHITNLHLNLKIRPTKRDLNPWRILKLPLERLFYAAMPIYCDESGTTGITEVLDITATCSKTLKILEMFQPPVGTSRPLKNLTSKLTNLEEIYCYGNVFSSLDFTNKTPNLKVLYLDYKCFCNLDKVFKLTEGSDYLETYRCYYSPEDIPNLINDLKCPNPLRNLVRFHIDLELNTNSWSKVARWLPNLRILEATLTDKSFQAVCKYLTNLEELVLLYESFVGDLELTGLETKPRNPDNLTNLKNLRKFEMKRTCGIFKTPIILPEAEGLQDLSVNKAFLEMKNLQEVQIQASEKMTIKAICKLKSHVKKVVVIRGYENLPHADGECCRVTSFLRSVKFCQDSDDEDDSDLDRFINRFNV